MYLDTYGYPGEISQIILNLIVNATHSIAHQGIIAITSNYNDTHVIFSVSDNGHGISDEHINNIFDPFFTTKDVDIGTGLGLSITHGIIKKHNGTIDVKTEEGKGTTFTISIPLIKEQG